MKNHKYCLFDEIINIKDFDPNNTKLDETWYKNILICYIGYMTIKKDLTIDSVNLLYLIFINVNGYFEEINGNKYLTLVPANESKENIKKNEELWFKIRNLIKSVSKKSDDYHGKYMRIKFDSDEKLPLNKTTKIPLMKIAVRAVFHENNKYYPQVFLDELKIMYLKEFVLKITATIRYF